MCVWGGGICVCSVVQCVCGGTEGGRRGGQEGGENLQEPCAISSTDIDSKITTRNDNSNNDSTSCTFTFKTHVLQTGQPTRTDGAFKLTNNYFCDLVCLFFEAFFSFVLTSVYVYA